MPFRGLRRSLFPRIEGEGAAPILSIVRALAAATPLGTAGFLCYVVVFAALPLAAIVVNGHLVAAVPAAVREGMTSPPGRRLTVLLLVTFGIYAAQQLGQLGIVFVAGLGRRLHRFLHLKLIRGMLAYQGIAHLEDPVTMDEIARAKGVAFGSGPGQLLLLNVAPVLVTRPSARP